MEKKGERKHTHVRQKCGKYAEGKIGTKIKGAKFSADDSVARMLYENRAYDLMSFYHAVIEGMF